MLRLPPGSRCSLRCHQAFLRLGEGLLAFVRGVLVAKGWCWGGMAEAAHRVARGRPRLRVGSARMVAEITEHVSDLPPVARRPDVWGTSRYGMITKPTPSGQPGEGHRSTGLRVWDRASRTSGDDNQ